MKKTFLRIISFLMAFILVFAGMIQILDFKYLDSIFKIESFYKLEDNTVDVLTIGSSHAYQGINTAVLWNEYGIASFNLCGAAQPIWNTYYYLEEALKTQTPKAIIVDTYYLHMAEDFSDTATAIKNTYGLKWSDTKKEAIKASFDTETSGNQYFYSILQYHSRYSDLKKSDFYPYQANKAMYENHKGFYCYFRSEELPEKNLATEKSYEILTEKVDYYYRKIFELAQSKNISVIPVAIPFNADYFNQRICNTAEYIAEADYGTTFYNFNTEYKDDIDLCYITDFADKQHLNHLGNTKLSRFLGDILKNQYNVPDRRNDAKYESWEADAAVYYNQLANHEVTKIKNLADYSDVFKNDRYTIVMTASYLDINTVPIEARRNIYEFFKTIEITEDEMFFGGMWIFENGEKIYYNDCSAKNFTKAVRLGKYDGIEIRKHEYYFDEIEAFFAYDIYANKEMASVSSYGLNIYVYDNFTQSKVDLAALRFSDNKFVR